MPIDKVIALHFTRQHYHSRDMKSKCIIHIGTHKTGSTSIQETFGSLPFEGVQYMDFDPDSKNQSCFMATILWEEPETYHTYQRLLYSKLYIETVKNRFLQIFYTRLREATLNGDVIVISAEDLCDRSFSYESILKLKHMLDDYCSEYEIICYIRPPSSFMPSAYQEVIKSGGSWFDLTRLVQQYRSGLEKFELIFGRQALHFIKFSPECLYKEDVVHDFAKRLNIELNDADIVRTNESMSLEAAAVLFLQRKYGRGHGLGAPSLYENKLLLDQLKHLGNSELVFSPQVVNSILEFNKDDIEWVQGLVGETITDLPTAVTHTVIASEEDLVSTALKQRDNLLAMLFNLKKSRALTVENLAGLVDDLRYELADHNSDGSQPLAEPSSFDINKEFLAVARHAEAEPADILREVALALERGGDLKSAGTVISVAHGLRQDTWIAEIFDRLKVY